MEFDDKKGLRCCSLQEKVHCMKINQDKSEKNDGPQSRIWLVYLVGRKKQTVMTSHQATTTKPNQLEF